MDLEEQFIKKYEYSSGQFINTSLINELFPFKLLDEESQSCFDEINLKENEVDNLQDNFFSEMIKSNKHIPIEKKNLKLFITEKKGQNNIKYDLNKNKPTIINKIFFMSKRKII